RHTRSDRDWSSDVCSSDLDRGRRHDPLIMRTLACLSLLLIAVAAPAAVVQPLGTSNSVLIPAAGSTAGVNGTFFRSDITIVNLADRKSVVQGKGGDTCGVR